MPKASTVLCHSSEGHNAMILLANSIVVQQPLAIACSKSQSQSHIIFVPHTLILHDGKALLLISSEKSKQNPTGNLTKAAPSLTVQIRRRYCTTKSR